MVESEWPPSKGKENFRVKSLNYCIGEVNLLVNEKVISSSLLIWYISFIIYYESSSLLILPLNF